MTRMRTVTFGFAFGWLAFVGPVAAQNAASGPQLVLTPGDSVRIVVWRKPELSGDFVIAPDGSITHPLYRSVKIAGLPFARAESNLRTFLAQYEDNPQFVMEPLIRVAVSGEVTRPSVFATRPEATFVTPASDPNRVLLPAPLAPTTATSSPGASVRLTESMTWWPPRRTTRSWATSLGPSRVKVCRGVVIGTVVRSVVVMGGA